MTVNEFDEANDPTKLPESGAVVKGRKKRWRHEANTRRALAWGIIGSTLVLYGYLVLAVVARWISQDQFTAIVAALAPLQSLAAATVGFFFARKD